MTNLITKSCLITLLFLLALSFSPPAHTKSINKNDLCKQFDLYYHDILFTGTNQANATSVAISNDTALGNHFGKTVVFNDRLTEDGHPLSNAVGRAQGFYFYNGKDKFNAWFAFTLVLDNSCQGTGTLNVMGADIISEETRDFSIVGGTGDFFMTRGICSVQTDVLQGDNYFRLKMEIKLYECNKKE